MLDRDGFLEVCRRVLSPHAIRAVAQQLARRLQRFNPRLAYYFNPHLVLTREIQCEPRDRSKLRRAIEDWAIAARPAFHGGRAGESPPEQTLGGVPAGPSVHEEVYFEVHSGRAECSLHQGGRSFRVRLTKQPNGSDPWAARVLLIQTRYPVADRQLPKLSPTSFWNHLNVEDYPAFAELDSVRAVLVASTALPCVVDCLVAYLDHDAASEITLDSLVSNLKGAAYPVARIRKSSIKHDLRTWRQDAATGKMAPRWAYLTFDCVEVTVGGPQSSVPSVSQVDWSDLCQIELELGPNAAIAEAGLGAIGKLDTSLSVITSQLRPVYGRKIHRLLAQRGFAMGESRT